MAYPNSCRIVSVLAATGATAATLEDAYSVVRKFRWTTSRKAQPPVSGTEGVGQETRTHSVSQLDFDSKVENFEALVKMVSMEPSYGPNEANLQVPALVAKAANLRRMNTAVINAAVTLSNARASRNKVLYNTLGIHGTALATKRYVRGAFGGQSAAYDQIKSLHFANIKKAG